MLIRKIAKAPKRSSRYRSQRHLAHVRSHACVVCNSETYIQAAHYRIGSGAGMGQKPDDWRTTPLCHACHHSDQHTKGEDTFWEASGKDPLAVIEALIATSPVRREIEAHRNG
jgi:hypothetical protein